MIAYQPRDAGQLIEDAIARNGAARVLKAAILALLRERPRQKPRPPDAAQLSGYLRRDIGLAQEPEAADWNRYLP